MVNPNDTVVVTALTALTHHLQAYDLPWDNETVDKFRFTRRLNFTFTFLGTTKIEGAIVKPNAAQNKTKGIT